MEKKISGLIITPMWREFMDFALTKRDQESFREPLATPSDIKPILRGVWFDASEVADDITGGEANLRETLSSSHSILYYVDKDDPRGPTPTHPGRDPQFELWEYPIKIWREGIEDIISSETLLTPSL